MSGAPLKAFKGFPVWSSTLVALVIVTALYSPGLPDSWRREVAAGVLISGLSSMSGYLLLHRAVEATNRTFIKLVLGGMVGRLFAALGAIVALIFWLGLEPLPLAVACLGSYVLLALFEYYFLLRNSTRKSRTRS